MARVTKADVDVAFERLRAAAVNVGYGTVQTSNWYL